MGTLNHSIGNSPAPPSGVFKAVFQWGWKEEQKSLLGPRQLAQTLILLSPLLQGIMLRLNLTQKNHSFSWRWKIIKAKVWDGALQLVLAGEEQSPPAWRKCAPRCMSDLSRATAASGLPEARLIKWLALSTWFRFQTEVGTQFYFSLWKFRFYSLPAVQPHCVLVHIWTQDLNPKNYFFSIICNRKAEESGVTPPQWNSQCLAEGVSIRKTGPNLRTPSPSTKVTFRCHLEVPGSPLL